METKISYEKPQRKGFKDITGQKFNRLTIISFAYRKRKKGYTQTAWNCLCECGNTTVVLSHHLSAGRTQSCGCLKQEQRKNGVKQTTHGLTNHPLYKRCANQIYRCHNSDHYQYESYGARGIKVCDRWKNDIGLMIKEVELEIGLPLSSDLDIDRIDNNGNYEPGNLRWADKETNARNRRCSHDHASDPITRKNTTTYRSWISMNFYHKGRICQEWINDKNPDTTNGFQQFLADMGEKPKGTKFRRINKLKEFSKSNCYWG